MSLFQYTTTRRSLIVQTLGVLALVFVFVLSHQVKADTADEYLLKASTAVPTPTATSQAPAGSTTIDNTGYQTPVYRNYRFSPRLDLGLYLFAGVLALTGMGLILPSGERRRQLVSLSRARAISLIPDSIKSLPLFIRSARLHSTRNYRALARAGSGSRQRSSS